MQTSLIYLVSCVCRGHGVKAKIDLNKNMLTLKQGVIGIYVLFCAALVSSFIYFFIYIRRHRKEAYETSSHLMFDIQKMTNARFEKTSSSNIQEEKYPQNISDVKVGSILFTQPWPFKTIGFTEKLGRLKPNMVNLSNSAQPIATHCAIVVKVDTTDTQKHLLDRILLLEQCQTTCTITTLRKALAYALEQGQDLYMMQFNQEISEECIKHFFTAMGIPRIVPYAYEYILHAVLPRYDKGYATPVVIPQPKPLLPLSSSSSSDSKTTKTLLDRKRSDDNDEETATTTNKNNNLPLLWQGVDTDAQTCSSLIYALLEHANKALRFKPANQCYDQAPQELNHLCQQIWHPLQVAPYDFLKINFQYVNEFMPESIHRIVI
jgi:hypothetical protein